MPIFRKQRSKRNIGGGTESVWNLFVQILLPLILILSFLSILNILRYKTVAEVEGKRSQILTEEMKNLIAKYDPERQVVKTKQQILDIQKQKLLKELEKVKYEERKTFKLVRFMDGNDVDLEDANIADDDFKFLCTNIREKIFDRYQEQNYLNDLYQKILKNAEVEDRDPQRLRVRRWPKAEATESTFKEVMIAQPGTISRENREHIHNEIIGFVNDFQKEVIELQSGVLIRIFNALIEHPEELDRSSKNLVKEILNPETVQITRANKASEFRRRQIGEIKGRVKEYHFLDETWQQIAKIN